MVEDATALPQAMERTLRRGPCGLVLDIDGTIAPIAPRPEDARVSPVCREHIAALAGRLEMVAVISGRPAQEARDMLDLGGIEYLGCYGLESFMDGQVMVRPEALPFQRQVQKCAGLLGRRLAGLPEMDGLLIENKRASVTFHYRACKDHRAARRVILGLLDGAITIGGVRVTEARRAVELVPDVAVDKGTAFSSLAEGSILKGIFCVGDDRADVQAFRALKRWRSETGGCGLALAVTGPEAPPELGLEADFSLPGVPGVEEFLQLLRRMATWDLPSGRSSVDVAKEEGPPTL